MIPFARTARCRNDTADVALAQGKDKEGISKGHFCQALVQFQDQSFDQGLTIKSHGPPRPPSTFKHEGVL